MFPFASTLISAHPSACHTAGGSGLPASRGLNLTLGPSPRGPSQRPWRCKVGDWGTPSPSATLSLPPRCQPGHEGRHRSFRAGEWAGPSEPLATFEGPSCQNAWAHIPRSPVPSSEPAPPLAAQLADRAYRPPGGNPNPSRPPSGPSQGAWRCNAGDWGPPSSSAGLTLPTQRHRSL